MANLEQNLDPFENVIWSGKPDKKAFVAGSRGIPFALFFLLGAFLFHSFGVPLFEFPVILLIIVASGLIIIPPPLQVRKYTNTEYMITKQRLRLLMVILMKMDLSLKL